MGDQEEFRHFIIHWWPSHGKATTETRAVYTACIWDLHWTCTQCSQNTDFLPGQVHAAVSEVGGRVEVLSAGSQHQVNTPPVLDPELGSSLVGRTSWEIKRRSTAVHHLPSKVDILQATGAEEAFGKYLGKRKLQLLRNKGGSVQQNEGSDIQRISSQNCIYPITGVCMT